MIVNIYYGDFYIINRIQNLLILTALTTMLMRPLGYLHYVFNNALA